MKFFSSHFWVNIEEKEVLNNSWISDINFFLPLFLNTWETKDNLSKHSSKSTNSSLFLIVSIYLNYVLKQYRIFYFSLLNKPSKNLLFKFSKLISLFLGFSKSFSLSLFLLLLSFILFLESFDFILSLFFILNCLGMNFLGFFKIVNH